MSKEESVIELSRRYPNLVVRFYQGVRKPYYSTFDEVPVSQINGDPVVLLGSYQNGIAVSDDTRHVIKPRG